MENLITIATFEYSSEAYIIKGKLESEGITTFMADNFTIDADPLLSNAIGGVKIKVKESQKEKALKVLNSISKYSLNDKGEKISCPNCNSHKIDYFSNIKDITSLFSFLAGLLFGILPFYKKYQYRCEGCKTQFNL